MKLSSLKEFKKEQKNDQVISTKKVLLLGGDCYTLKAFQMCKDRFGLDQIFMGCEYGLKEQDFFPLGPSTLRMEHNLNFLKLDQEQLCGAKFIKEGVWRDFGGRAHSYALRPGENFFSKNSSQNPMRRRAQFSEEQELLSNVALNYPKKIGRAQKTDLLDNAKWSVEFSSGEVIRSDYLVWGRGPSAFFECLKHTPDLNTLRTQLSSHLEFYNQVSVLTVTLNFPFEVTNMKETLFFPLSATYDEGHFIGDFHPYDEEKGEQRAELIYYFSEVDVDEENVAQKFRALKRILEKTFDFKWEKSISEYIRLHNEEILRNEEKLPPSLPHLDEGLYFIGESAPLRLPSSVSYLVRGLQSLEEWKHCLNPS